MDRDKCSGYLECWLHADRYIDSTTFVTGFKRELGRTCGRDLRIGGRKSILQYNKDVRLVEAIIT